VFGGTALTYTGLYKLWYADEPMQSFHWINDSREWRGMDKCGHTFSAFQLSNQTYQWYRWAGHSRQKSAGISAISALVFQNPLEIFDGFSRGWGASKADLAANAAGALLASSQLFCWGRTKMIMRFSYLPTDFAALRPGTLGSSHAERLMKDYNGQTYWISASLTDLVGKQANIPPWLGLAIGYGADGLLGGYRNQWQDKNGMWMNRSDVARSSQWYLAPDIRLSMIPVQNTMLKQVFRVLDMFKFPLPGLMYQEGKMKIKAVCY
jgi:hypothetical protein